MILLAPPWPRGGSSNIFAAQAAAHARRGARVFLLLTPTGPGFSRHKTGQWLDATSSMRFRGVEAVAYPCAGRGRLSGHLQWWLAGRDDSLAIMARYGASGRLPAELASFLASTRVDLVHVNHVFSIPLAQRVVGSVQRLQGHRPRLLLDTHDVQSDALAIRKKKNPFSRQLDSPGGLLRTELTLCAQADALIHLTQADCNFLAAHLPEKHHTVVLPTLAPESEADLIRSRGHGVTGAYILYIGTHHDANLATVRWLLTEVLPQLPAGVTDRIRIVGSVGGLVSRREPALFQRHARLFVGEVHNVFECYAGARAVLAPAALGTGTSIKLIEALCAGKLVLTTDLGLRGLPSGALPGSDIEVHDTAAGFAEALTRWAEAPIRAFSEANAVLYDRVFSNERYFGDLDRLLMNDQVATPRSAGSKS